MGRCWDAVGISPPTQEASQDICSGGGHHPTCSGMHPAQSSRRKSCLPHPAGAVCEDGWKNEEKPCCASSNENISFSQMQSRSSRALLKRRGDGVMATTPVPCWESGKRSV